VAVIGKHAWQSKADTAAAVDFCLTGVDFSGVTPVRLGQVPKSDLFPVSLFAVQILTVSLTFCVVT